jgi:hypothetical protein
MKKILLLVVASLCCNLVYSQTSTLESPTIATDRPDQTESPFLTPTNWFQIETGVWSEKIMKGSDVNSITIPTILTKYGVNKNVELRLITEYNLLRGNSSTILSGVPPITVGLKTALLKGKKFIPKTSLITHLGLHFISSKDYAPSSYAPSFRFLMQHTLSDKLNFSYNLGAQWDGNSAYAENLYTISFAYAISNKLGAFVESYGFVSTNNTIDQDHRADAGITYLLNDHHQLDVSAGLGITDVAPPSFISCGYSFRFKR